MKRILTFFVLSRIMFLTFALSAANFISLKQGYLGTGLHSNEPYITWIWANFDGQHFLKIAEFGYSGYEFAFFPLYPITIHIMHTLLSTSYLYSGIIVSLLCFLVSLFVVQKIIRLDYSEHTAKIALFIICFYPLSFFYHSVYTDSLFFLVSTASFYFARTNNWYMAGIFGLFATASRVTGVALVVALTVEWFIQHGLLQIISSKVPQIKPWLSYLALQKSPNFNKVITVQRFSDLILRFIKRGFIPLTIACLGLFLYIGYLQFYYNDGFLFQKSMSAWRQDNVVFPPQVVFRYLKIFYYVDYRLYEYKIAVLEFVTLIIYVALSFYTLFRVRISYGVYMLVLLTMVTFTGTIAGTPRYILHSFPAFLAISLLIKKRSIFIALIVCFLLLGLLLTGFFTRGYFVS